jgi:hypothetical protein
LIHIDDRGSRSTGEGVARIARTYSKCKFVVVLNQFSKVDFDLGMTGHLNSFADLNIDSKLVGEPALWIADADCDFRPSYWTPILPVVSSRATYLDSADDLLGKTILEILGLEPGELHGISDTAFAYLSAEAEQLSELSTVKATDFLQRVLGEPESKALLASSQTLASAFIVARLAKWLERAALRPLDALVDAAHLAERRPYLLDATAEQMKDVEYWASLRGKEAAVLESSIPADVQLAVGEAWLGRPVYVNRRLEQVAGIRKKSEAFDYSILPDVVFAEDSSRFVPRDQAEEFRAGFNNFSDRRFVENFGDRTYGPQRRFAFGD